MGLTVSSVEDKFQMGLKGGSQEPCNVQQSNITYKRNLLTSKSMVEYVPHSQKAL
jgi:hypothetical protein